MEATVEAVNKSTTELIKEGVGVTKFHLPILCSLEDLLP